MGLINNFYLTPAYRQAGFPSLPKGERAGGEGAKERRKKMREQIEKALERIRPALQADGGDVELVDVAEGVVKVRLKGACGG
jgi:hypothetical protein